jgi:periplasmic protein TonB
MRSLFQKEVPDSRRISRMAWLSIGVHCVLIALIAAGTWHRRRTIIFRPMTQGAATSVSVVSKSQAEISALPALQKQAPRPHPVQKPKIRLAKPKPAVPELPASSASVAQTPAVSPSGSSGSGADSQSMYPAYPIVSPSPQVKDRSLLPPTDQRVIVDVNLGTDGQVQQATLVSGLGTPLDQLVLDTVRGWQFHPAMLNGNPVPSSIELVFPFNRNYPMAE